MSNRRKSVPSYRRHKDSGQAIVTLPDGHGRRRDVLLGTYGTKASKAEYARVIAEWHANGCRPPTVTAATELTVNELIDAFWPHVERHYRKGGEPTNEVRDYALSLRPLRHLYGKTLVRDFGPLALESVRGIMVSGYTHPKHGEQGSLSRKVVNQRVKRIQRMFRWAVSKQLIQPSIYAAVSALEGLKQWRSDARETEPVRPVARAVVEETLPLLQPMVADMVRLQLETGMRSGEMVTMRAIDIDTTGKVWLYKPKDHKTQHHGHGRVVTIGPRAQEIISRYLTVDTQAYLFSPARCMDERRAALRLARKTPVQPSQRDRSKSSAKRTPGSRYTTESYGKSIAAAIKRYNAKRPESEHVPHWHPHQLRHTRALEIKRKHGLDKARQVLGHSSPVVTEMYAGIDVASAAEVMAEMG